MRYIIAILLAPFFAAHFYEFLIGHSVAEFLDTR